MSLATPSAGGLNSSVKREGDSAPTTAVRPQSLAIAVAQVLGNGSVPRIDRAVSKKGTETGSIIPHLPAPDPEAVRGPGPGVSSARKKLWQLAPKYHCSILGVCLGIDEMRRLASKLGIRGSAEVLDYHLHHQLVHCAGSANHAGRRLNRHLEVKFAASVRALRAHGDEASLRAGWERTAVQDDLGGAYWALLTHPAITETLADEALGHVHMFSHSAASDMRRVRAEIEYLRSQLAEQEHALHRERTARDKQAAKLQKLEKRNLEIDDFTRLLKMARRRISELENEAVVLQRPETDVCPSAEVEALQTRIEKSERETRTWRLFCRRAEQRLREMDYGGVDLQTSTPDQESSGQSCACRDGDVSSCDDAARPCDLHGHVLAYVGGRDRIVPRLRALTERCNGEFVHHDGGLQQRPGRIDECLARADILVVPLDCVSHDASRRLKRSGRRLGKTILWLRTASVSAFESALRQLNDQDLGARPCT